MEEAEPPSIPGGVATQAILSKLDAQSYYDAHQMATALINRNIAKGRHVLAISLCATLGVEFIKRQQYALGATLGLLMVKVYKEFELPVTETAIGHILALFEPRPPVPIEERRRFIERALKWAHEETSASADTNPSGRRLVARLHDAAGRAFRDEKEYGLSQAHFLQTVNVTELARLIKMWMDAAYPSERELFLLRTVMALLVQGNVAAASELVQSPLLGLNFDNKQFLPPLQLAYLLPEACKLPSPSFLDVLKSKYSLVIRRDPGFARLMSDIDQRYFGRGPVGGPDLFNLLSTMF